MLLRVKHVDRERLMQKLFLLLELVRLERFVN